VYPTAFRTKGPTAALSAGVNELWLTLPPDQARSYFSRWDLVREVEATELQRTSMETKLRQLAALMASRHLFAPDPDRETQICELRERWARLRKALGGCEGADIAEPVGERRAGRDSQQRQ